MFLEQYLTQVPVGTGWASDAEMASHIAKECRGLSRGGPVLYNSGGSQLVDGSDSHTLILGSTGSGKTFLVILPSIEATISAGVDSLVVFDIKGDLEQKTKGLAKKMRYTTASLNLRDPSKSDIGYDPFRTCKEAYACRQHEEAFLKADDVAEVLCLPDGSDSHVDPFWRRTALSFVRGLLRGLLEKGSLDMRHVVRFINLVSCSSTRDRVMKTGDLMTFYQGADSEARTLMAPVVEMSSDQTRSCQVATLQSYAAPFTSDPLLRLMCDMPALDFQCLGKKRTILYVQLPDDRETLGTLQRAMLTDMYMSLTDLALASEGCRLPVGVHFFIDEMPNIRPSLPDLDKWLAVSRSRGLRYTLAAQSWSQLVSVYRDKADTLASNCGTWICLYAARDTGFTNRLIELCGEDPFGQPLLTRAKLNGLPFGQAIVLRERCKPYVTLLDQPLADKTEICSHPVGKGFQRSKSRTSYDLSALH